MLNRRDFLANLGAAGATLTAARGANAAAGEGSPAGPTVDVNVSLSRWPFRRLPLDETAKLLERMSALGITSAWAGSFEALLHRDMEGVNARLAAECGAAGGRLQPFGGVNPMLPDWEEDLRRCHEVHRMPGIRLFPNYHGYTLASSELARLLQLATARRMLVQVCIALEDRRTQHPLVSVPDVDAGPLADLLSGIAGARVMLLNAGRNVPVVAVKKLAALGVTFDTARVEGAGGVGAFVRSLPAGAVVFGTHAPFFNYEAGLLKIFESELSASEMKQVMSANARAVLSVA